MLYLHSISKCMLGSALVRDCLRSASHVLASIKPVSKSFFYLVSYLMCVESLCFQGFCSMVPVRYPSLSFLILLLSFVLVFFQRVLSGYIPKPTPSSSPNCDNPCLFYSLFIPHLQRVCSRFTLFNYSFEVLKHLNIQSTASMLCPLKCNFDICPYSNFRTQPQHCCHRFLHLQSEDQH